MPYQSTWNNPYLAQNPYQPVTQQQTVQPYQQPVNGIVKVNGRESALQYWLPPNSISPALFDNGGKVFYVVSTDGAGAKSVECFDFAPHVEQAQATGTAEYVSRQDFEALAAKVTALTEALDGLNGAVPAGRADIGASVDSPGRHDGDGGPANEGQPRVRTVRRAKSE